MSWKTQLERASFRGVSFDCQTVDDEISRRLVEHKFPYRSGSEFEDLGGEARSTRLRAVFMGETYESDLGALLKVVDAGLPGRFQHPILGQWQARIRRSPVNHSHERYSMAMVDLDVVEDGADAELPDLFTVAALEAEVEDLCLEIEAIEIEEVDALTTAIADVRQFVSDVQAAANRVTSLVNSVRNKIDQAVAAVRAISDVGNWPIVRALKKLSYSCLKLAERVRQASPSVVLKRLEASMPLSLLAHSLYGTGVARADEILGMNRIKNPFLVTAGTEIKVPSK